MQYRLELDIDRPRQRVVELFLDPANLARWQPSLVSFEPLGDGARQVGARSRQVHTMGRRTVEMIETITVHDYPDRFSATYEADGIWNLIENRFLETDANRTHWVLDTELRCTGLIVRLMTVFAPGLFRRQTLTFMKHFKEFAEAAD